MLLLSLLLAVSTFAADTGVLILQGTVDVSCHVVITPNGTNNTTLDIINGESNKLVASSNETCNNPAGYKINMKSDNGGVLKHTTVATSTTGYQLVYGGQTVTLTTAYQEVKNVTSLAAPADNDSDININVTALPSALAGTHEDLVTVQIVAN